MRREPNSIFHLLANLFQFLCLSLINLFQLVVVVIFVLGISDSLQFYTILINSCWVILTPFYFCLVTLSLPTTLPKSGEALVGRWRTHRIWCWCKGCMRVAVASCPYCFQAMNHESISTPTGFIEGDLLILQSPMAACVQRNILRLLHRDHPSW